MKRVLASLAFLLAATAGFAQNRSDYDELMSKSRKARTTSTILVATGPVIAAGGIGTLLYGLIQSDIGDSRALYDNNGNFIGYEDKKYTTEIVVGAAGTLVELGLALTSIHFSKKASELKREARGIKLNSSMENISIPGLQNGFVHNRARQFRVSLVIPLGS